MKWLGPLLLLILVAASQAASQVPDDRLIVPGMRIGKWTLEMAVEDLVRMNGPASMQEFSPERTVFANRFFVFTWRQPYSLSAFSLDEKTVVALTVAGQEAESLGTRGKIRPFSSTVEQVTATYGRPTGKTGPSVALDILVYDEIGVAFTSVSNLVAAIWVFRPRTAKSIWKF